MSALETANMKKAASIFSQSFFLLFTCAVCSSCLKDRCTRHFTVYTPVMEKLSTLRAGVKSLPAQPMEQPGKIFIQGNWIFVNEMKKGIHVIDNSNPAHPVKKSFIAIPGNIDMYASGNYLYADLYCDLTTLDISNPSNVTISKFLTKTFPDKVPYTLSQDPDSINVITRWVGHDTVADCTSQPMIYTMCPNCSGTGLYTASAYSSGGAKAMAGSQARFAAVDNFLYAVTTSTLNIMDISQRNNPVQKGSVSVGWDVETIFPYENKLYIGAGSSMRVLDIKDPVNPVQLSWNGHWCSHDPVIVDGNFAYVTLHAANTCSGTINQLEVYDLSNELSPVLSKTYSMKYPQGLSKDGNLLFVCDDGLKVYDATIPTQLVLKAQLRAGDAYDVIAQHGNAIVTGKQGVYQFNYTDPSHIYQISSLKY